jgi:hypothetical protein
VLCLFVLSSFFFFCVCSGLAAIRSAAAVEDSIGARGRSCGGAYAGKRGDSSRGAGSGVGKGNSYGTSKGKSSRGKRLRSRNRVVDAWLGDEDGSDAYADLEDFLVE